MKAETFKVTLKRPRGSIKEIIVDVQEIHDYDNNEYYYRAWICVPTTTLEFQQCWAGERDVMTFYPFDGKDTYYCAGVVYARKPIETIAGWKEWLQEYVENMDPRDLYRERRRANL